MKRTITTRSQALCHLFNQKVNRKNVRYINRFMRRDEMKYLEVCYVHNPDSPVMMKKQDLKKYSMSYTAYTVEPESEGESEEKEEEIEDEMVTIEEKEKDVIPQENNEQLDWIIQDKPHQNKSNDDHVCNKGKASNKTENKSPVDTYECTSSSNDNETQEVMDGNRFTTINNAVSRFRTIQPTTNNPLVDFERDLENMSYSSGNTLFPEEFLLQKYDKELENWKQYGFSTEEAVSLSFCFARLYITKREMLRTNNYTDGKPLSEIGTAETFLTNKKVPIEKLRKNPSLETVEKYCSLPEQIKYDMQFPLVILVTLLQSFQPEPHQGKTILLQSYQEQQDEMEIDCEEEENDIGYISYKLS